jgi:hypothetical protein
VYLCGASLIHKSWVLTHSKCAAKCDPKTEYCVARLGSYRDTKFQSAYEQFRRIVMFVQLTGDSLTLFVVFFSLDKPISYSKWLLN